MTTQFMIYCCPGTGGLFLTSVVAQILNINVRAEFSNTGHAHDMGRGNWNGHTNVCFIGNHWNINYRSNQNLYYSHVIPDNFLNENPNVKLIKVTSDACDFRKITEMYVKKAWPDIWTQQEYNKWAGSDYPPYSPDNIKDSEVIVNDLINDFEHSITQEWYNLNKGVTAEHTIDFRTIMGIDNKDLINEVCKIVNCIEPQGVRQYVHDYQQLNQEMYFTDYV